MADDLKVLIVDDSKLVIAQLERIVANVEGVDIVGKATDGALRFARRPSRGRTSS